MAKPKLRVGISGSYGGLNLGDEAILQSIVAQLRRSAPAPLEVTVFSRDAADTRRRHDVDRTVPVRTMSRDEILPEIGRLDLLILGGGGILYDADARIYLREVVAAHEMGVPVMIYAVGVGPLHDAAAQTAVREALDQAAAITVRDTGALRALEDLGVRKQILVTADPALLLTPEALPAEALRHEGLTDAERVVGLSVREPGPAAPDIDQEQYHTLLANAADFIVDRYDAHIAFVPMERHGRDLQHSHAVIARMLRPQRATVLRGKYTSGQLLELMGHFDMAIGMRLHFLMFAALRGVAFVALPYAGKVSGFLEALDIGAPPLQLASSGRLIAYLDHSWDERRSLKARIRQRLPALRRSARENNRVATQLLEARLALKSQR
jgi:polysaccharide pyruvyl transferase CsaB